MKRLFLLLVIAIGISLSGSHTVVTYAQSPTIPPLLERARDFLNAVRSNQCITQVGEPDPDTAPGPIGCASSGSGPTTGGTTGGPGGACRVNAPPQSNYTQAIQREFGVTFLPGFSEQQLRWVYEAFYAVSVTRFLPLVQNSIIAPTSRADFVSWQESCPVGADIGGNGGPDVYFNTNLDEVATKTLIIHELTHVAQICNNNGITNLSEIRSAYAQEGGISNYSRTGCGFNINLYNEDHADTIALHLNPKSWPQTCNYIAETNSYREPFNPFDTGRFPRHKQFAIQLVGNYSCNE